MIDYGTRHTDLAVKRAEWRLSRVYHQAEKDINEKLKAWQKRHERREAMYRKQLAEGKITQADFDAWMRGQVFQGKQWQARKEEIQQTLLNADNAAAKIVNEGKLGVFATNANYVGYGLEHDANINTGFTLYDEQTVARLIKSDPQILPKARAGVKKDKAYSYYNKLVNGCITQGIIQGEDIRQIAKRIADKTGESSYKSAVRNARTAFTGAQNAGRIEGLHQAQSLGIKVQKQWMATLDSRTRDAHADLDGQVQEVDDPFESDLGDIMFPGDPAADPANVWNCRCTLTYVYPEYPSEMQRRDNETGEPVGDMTYREWEQMKRGGWANDTPAAEYLQDKTRYEELRGKYGDATSAMLFGTPEDAADFVRTQNSVYEYAASRGDFKTAYESQPITEKTLETWRTQPTQTQKDAIRTYSRNGYKGMNDYLRHGGSLQGVDKTDIDALQAYLTENSTKQDMFLKRGISTRSLDEMLGKGWKEDMGGLAGRSATDRGFMSTSPFSPGNFGKNAVMYLKAPDGTQGAYIADIIGGEKKTEQEFLLPYDTTIKITRAYTTQNKYGDTIPVIEAVIDRRRRRG